MNDAEGWTYKALFHASLNREEGGWWLEVEINLKK